MSVTQAPMRIFGIRLATLLRKAATLLVVCVIFGWIYAWTSPWAFPRETRAGLGYGLVHGALMPLALPSLAIGKNVEIYAANNSGRLYKIGYIIGINVCGLVFFGSTFWQPARKKPVADPGGGEPQKNQLR